MSKMSEHCAETGLIWTVTVGGDPLGYTFKDDSHSLRQLVNKGSLPTEEAARRVARDFRKWIEHRFPNKQTPQSQYFAAFPGMAIKVFPSRRDEEGRRRNGNHFRDQSEANLAAQALEWLCQRERDRFEESGVQSVRPQASDAMVPA